MSSLKLVLVCGAGSTGKTHATERVLAIDYDVVTARADRFYERALEIAGVPRQDAVLDRDVEGRRVLDYCCATGALSFLLKQRGAAEVVGIDRDPVKYCKGLELRNTLRRHSQLDAEVDLRLGDALEILPTLPRSDTVVFFGALHYFSDYESTLGLVANAAGEAVYVEFNFRDREHDTAEAPDGIHPYTRSRYGETIYMGNRDTVERLIARSMPGFEVEERRAISPPGSRLRHEREVWRMRRSAAGPGRQPALRDGESRRGSPKRLLARSGRRRPGR